MSYPIAASLVRLHPSLTPARVAMAMLALRRALPSSLDATSVVAACPQLLALAPGDGLEAVVTSSLAELSFLPAPVLAELLADEPSLLLGPGVGRLERLRDAWTCSVEPEVLAHLCASPRLPSWVRNYLSEN